MGIAWSARLAAAGVLLAAALGVPAPHGGTRQTAQLRFGIVS